MLSIHPFFSPFYRKTLVWSLFFFPLPHTQPKIVLGYKYLQVYVQHSPFPLQKKYIKYTHTVHSGQAISQNGSPLRRVATSIRRRFRVEVDVALT